MRSICCHSRWLFFFIQKIKTCFSKIDKTISRCTSAGQTLIRMAKYITRIVTGIIRWPRPTTYCFSGQCENFRIYPQTFRTPRGKWFTAIKSYYKILCSDGKYTYVPAFRYEEGTLGVCKRIHNNIYRCMCIKCIIRIA